MRELHETFLCYKSVVVSPRARAINRKEHIAENLRKYSNYWLQKQHNNGVWEDSFPSSLLGELFPFRSELLQVPLNNSLSLNRFIYGMTSRSDLRCPLDKSCPTALFLCRRPCTEAYQFIKTYWKTPLTIKVTQPKSITITSFCQNCMI